MVDEQVDVFLNDREVTVVVGPVVKVDQAAESLESDLDVYLVVVLFQGKQQATMRMRCLGDTFPQKKLGACMSGVRTPLRIQKPCGNKQCAHRLAGVEGGSVHRPDLSAGVVFGAHRPGVIGMWIVFWIVKRLSRTSNLGDIYQPVRTSLDSA